MYDRILVPIDGSPTSERGLDEALKLARLTHARVMLLHAIDLAAVTVSPEGGAAVAALYDTLRDGGEALLSRTAAAVKNLDIPVETVLLDTLEGRVSDLVNDQARKWRADLIVIGTHGRRGFNRFLLGSDAEQIVRSAPVPVLLVRAPELDEKSGLTE